MRKKLLGIAVAILVTLSLIAIPLSGCAAPAPTTATPTTPTPTTPAPTTPTPTTATPTEELEPKYGGVLRIGTTVSSLVIGLPGEHKYNPDQQLWYTWIEALVKYNKEGGYEPWLATAWEEDGETGAITIHLREGVKFHDGTPFNAEAAKWNYDNYTELGGQGGRPYYESVDVIDDYTIRLNHSGYFATNIGILRQDMVSMTAYKAHGKEWAMVHPVGTGPFKFVSWEKDVNIKFERFDNYWGGKPYLDGVEWVFFGDSTVEMMAFLDGEIDAFIFSDAKTSNSLEGDPKYTVVRAPGWTTTIWADSVEEDSPWSKLKVRQAMNYAIDRQAICDSIGYGYWEPANQFGIPGRWEYNPDVVGYPYNPEKARQLLAEAGYPNGFETTISRNVVPPDHKLATIAIQGYLAEVGIDADLNLVETAQESEWWWHGGWPGLFNSGIVTNYPAQFNDLERHYVTTVTNPSAIKPKEVVDLLIEINKEPDFEARKAMVHQVQSLLVDKYCSPCFCCTTAMLFNKYSYLHDDGLYEITNHQWLPVSAWLDR